MEALFMSTKDSAWYSTPADRRNRKPIGLTLSAKALARLERQARARGLSRSEVVELLVMEASVRGPAGT